MAGKNDFFGRDIAVGRYNGAVSDRQNRRVLEDRKAGGQRSQKLQRVEAGLTVKAQRPLYGKGQLCLYDLCGGDTGLPCRYSFQMDGVWLLHSIEKSGSFLIMAADGAVFYNAFIFPDRFLIGLGIKLHSTASPVGEQPVINQVVLGRNFGSRTGCLAASRGIGLQDQDFFSLTGQVEGGQDSGHSGADNGDFRIQIAGKRISFGNPDVFAPNRFHNIHLPVRMCRFSKSNHACTQCPTVS